MSYEGFKDTLKNKPINYQIWWGKQLLYGLVKEDLRFFSKFIKNVSDYIQESYSDSFKGLFISS